MQMKEIDSSNIHAVGYSETDELLAVQFKTKTGEAGNTYYYKDVPEEEFREFMESDSKGRYFSSHIKGQYETVRPGEED